MEPCGSKGVHLSSGHATETSTVEEEIGEPGQSLLAKIGESQMWIGEGKRVQKKKKKG